MNDEPRIIHRGVSMLATWPERIRQAQLVTTYELREGSLPRIRYDEADE